MGFDKLGEFPQGSHAFNVIMGDGCLESNFILSYKMTFPQSVLL